MCHHGPGPLRTDLLLAIGLALCLTGCERAARPPSSRLGGLIVVIGAGQDDPLWPVLQACARRFERRSRDYEVQSHAPRVTSVQLQADLIASLPRGRLRGLCVQVIDPSASQAALDSLRNDGMVVVTLLKRLDTPGHFLHSGVDEHELGAALADALAALVESPGTVGTLEAKAQHDLRRRAQGFHARIGRYPRLTLLRELDCSQDPSVSAKMMQRTMERFAGLDGWAIMDNWPLRQGLGTHRLLPDSCRLVAPGPLANVAELIRTGQVDAVVLADYDDMVNKALQACAVTLDGELPLFREYNSTLLTVTADTLPEFQQRWKQWTQISEPAEQK